jgi:hypothetical protein
MGASHSAHELKTYFPDLYADISTAILHNNQKVVGYTLGKTNGEINIMPKLSPHIRLPFTDESYQNRHAELEKTVSCAWRKTEWLTLLSPTIVDNTFASILNKEIIYFKKINDSIEIRLSEAAHEALDVSEAFEKTRRNYDKVTKTTYDSRIFIETKGAKHCL